MKTICLIPSASRTRLMHRDVLYGCWCSGNRVGGGILPPLTLLTMATVLNEDGSDVTLIDMVAQEMSIEDIEGLATSFDVVVVLTSTMSFLEDLSVIGAIRGEKPGAENNFLRLASDVHAA